MALKYLIPKHFKEILETEKDFCFKFNSSKFKKSKLFNAKFDFKQQNKVMRESATNFACVKNAQTISAMNAKYTFVM